MAKDASQKKERKLPAAVTGYLLVFNGALALGWLWVMVLTLQTLAATGGDWAAVWRVVEWPLKYSQTAAVLEILHVAVGLVPSSLFTTFVQVMSRLLVLWVVCDQFPQVPHHWSFSTMVMAWAVTEVVRYTNYFAGLLNAKPYILLWLRYTLFYVLYPLGAGSECVQIYQSLPYITQDYLYYFLVVLMVLYIPLFPSQYFYMFGQRAKYLGSGTKKAAKAT